MNRKIVFGGIIAAFVIVIGIVGFSGSIIIDDISGGGIISSSQTRPEIFPLGIELEDITILEVTDLAATIEITFEVTNPNFKSIILQMIKYELYENDVRIATSQIGQLPTGMIDVSNYFTILNDHPTIFRDKITIKNTGNEPELWSALTNNTQQWKIKGEGFFNLSSLTSGGENEVKFEFTK